MDHYIDIKLSPDPEFTLTVLMNATFAKLHRYLIKVGEGRIGVSFPNHEMTLGDTLRLHGAVSDLNNLMAQSWLRGLTDYAQVGELSLVPANVKHRVVRRIQTKSAYNKLKRSVRKGWLSEQEAEERLPRENEKRLALPYAQIRSLSKDTVMRIYIEHGKLMDSTSPGRFSSYGLSKTATVPWF